MNDRFVDNLIDQIIEREGGYVDNPDDSGGPTRYGITRKAARAHGYDGDMRTLSADTARAIYREQYYTGPRFNWIARLSKPIARELTDTGVNMGPAEAVRFLQRSLNALNRKGELYSDIKVDGYVGQKTVAALQDYLDERNSEGEKVMCAALQCLQGARYIELSEIRVENQTFTYGWLKERVLRDGLVGSR